MKNIASKYCNQCGSHDLRQVKDRLVCNYCGTEYHESSSREYMTRLWRKFLQNRTAVKAVSASIVVLMAVTIIYNITRKKAGYNERITRKEDRIEMPADQIEAGKDSIEPEKKLSAEFTRISPLADVIGNIYFVGLYRNTGETPVLPRAEIALYDEKGKKVAIGRGYGIRNYILPGEATPISVLVTKAPPYAVVKSIGIPERPTFYQRRPRLSFSNLKMIRPEHKYDSHKVTGTVKNVDGKQVSYVLIAAVVYDETDRIAGHASNYLQQTVLAPGEEAPFTVLVYLMKGSPARFTIEYNASVYRKGR